MSLNENYKLLVKVAVIMLCFYALVMFVWNVTNIEHKPSNWLWDWQKEGFQENPLADRKKIN